MSRTLVAYFSAGGRTAKAARALAELLEADLYQIKPQVPYTRADLNWLNPRSRSSVEMRDRSSRPAIVTGDLDPAGYDTIYLGFPIWWYAPPTVVNTFLETYDLSGRRIILFATSGSSGFGPSLSRLQPSAPNSVFAESKVLHRLFTPAKLRTIADTK